MNGQTSALKRTLLLTGTGALIEAARRALKRGIARRKRTLAMRRTRSVFKKVGLAAAVAGLGFWTMSAIRAR
jgi:hypothetical protein